jgi:hypothetical protein
MIALKDMKTGQVHMKPMEIIAPAVPNILLDHKKTSIVAKKPIITIIMRPINRSFLELFPQLLRKSKPRMNASEPITVFWFNILFCILGVGIFTCVNKRGSAASF